MAKYEVIYILCLSSALAGITRAKPEGTDQDDSVYGENARNDLEEAYEIAASKALEIWNSLYGRKIIATFLRNTHEILTDKVATKLMVDVARQVRSTMQSPIGSRSVKSILDGLVQIGLNKDFNNNLQTALKNTKTVMSNPNSRILVEESFDSLNSLIHAEQTPALIDAIGDGFDSLLHFPDPQKTILNGFNTLRKAITVGNKGNANALLPSGVQSGGMVTATAAS